MDKNIESIYGLSPMQQGMLFHTLYSAESSSDYFEWLDFPLGGELDVAGWRAAWEAAFARHSILRTCFIWARGGEPLQVVRKRVELPWQELDWRECDADQQQARLKQFLAAEQAQGFELAKAPLMRLTLIRLSESAYHFVWSNHHLVLDGWSRVLLIKEVFASYNAARRGESIRLDQPRPFSDYIGWLKRQPQAEAERFWRSTLQHIVEPTPLPTGKPPGFSPLAQVQYERERISLSVAATARLQAFAREHKLTLNSIVQALWGLLLSRYSGHPEVVFGAVVSGRPPELEGVERMVGMFINTLPVKVRVDEEREVLEWIRELQGEQAEARQYEYSALAEVQGWSGVARGLPLFESVLVFESYPIDANMRASEADERQSIFIERTNYPLTALVIPGQRLSIQLSYSCAHFEKAMIERILEHLRALLGNLIHHPAQQLSHLSMLPDKEKEELVEKRNQTRTDYERHLSLAQLFARQARLTASNTALTYGSQSLSYAELDLRSNQWAHFLRARGVGSESPVALLLEPSPTFIVLILAVLKAGGCYLPLDPVFPAARLAFMLEDARAQLLLTTRTLTAPLEGLTQTPRLLVEEVERSVGELPETAGEWGEAAAEQLAYVMYTSGSTGQPKGIGITQRSVVRLVRNTNYVPFGEGLRMGQVSNLSFDASTFEVWGALLNGGEIVGISKEVALAPQEFAGELERKRIEAMFLTTALFNQVAGEVPRAFDKMKHLLVGGDAVDARAVRTVQRAGGPERLLNGYGPTESTTFAAYYEMRAVEEWERQIPIGQPIANTSLYVLDERLDIAPVGVLGELFIGGDGLARGYIGRPELTAQKFIPHPFSAEPGARLYRTGDLVRYLSDGNIEFVRRIDSQIKLRGFRIELGEIEAALTSAEQVRAAAVVLREDERGQKQLVAYLVSRDDQALDVREVRQQLQRRLPEYMVPAVWQQIEQLPLNANGKVDRARLPEVESERVEMGGEYVGPRDAIEEMLAQVWQEVLQVDRVGIHDNFFELGGDSILSIQVIARAARHGLRFTPRQLFQHQSISALAPHAQPEAALLAEQGTITGQLPLTPIQHWFLDQQRPNPDHFNQAVLLTARRPIDPALLEPLMQHIVAHHDALRLRFTRDEQGQWRQFNAPRETGQLSSFHDLSKSESPATALAAIADQWQRSLSLAEGPILHAALFELREGEPQRLLLLVHHLAVDGVSWRILLEDLERGYQQLAQGSPFTLGQKSSSFKQWAEQLERYADSAEVSGQRGYWQEVMESGEGVVPVEYQEGENLTGGVRQVRLELDEELTQGLLQEVARLYQTQINESLLSCLGRALWRWTGAKRWVVTLEGHGREEQIAERVSLARTVGWFTTSYPVRLRVGGEIAEDLEWMKEELRRVPEHGIGYGLLRHLRGELMGSPQEPEIVFNYLGQFDQVLEGESLWGASGGSVGAMRDERDVRGALLEINGSVVKGKLELSWGYGEGVMRRERVEELAELYREEVSLLVEHCREAGRRGMQNRYTPSDFPLANLNTQKLAKVASLLDSIE